MEKENYASQIQRELGFLENKAAFINDTCICLGQFLFRDVGIAEKEKSDSKNITQGFLPDTLARLKELGIVLDTLEARLVKIANNLGSVTPNQKKKIADAVPFPKKANFVCDEVEDLDDEDLPKRPKRKI